MSQKMYVLKRDGRKEAVHYDKITSRIEKLCDGLNMEFIDPPAITHKVVRGLYTGVTTIELDNLAAEIAATMTVKHPDYAILAGRIAVSNLHKQTKEKFSDVIEDLYNMVNSKTGKRTQTISDYVYKIVQQNADRLNSAIKFERDLGYSYFGYKTLERSYLLRKDGEVIERPQHLLMRVAVGIHGEDIDSALETYDLLSEKWFTHASPTLFNAGMPKAQLSSCFLLTMNDDSIDGIFKTLTQCAQISKFAGGIGLSVHNIRATGSYIAGTNGTSNGLVPLLRVFNNTARYVDQGGNKRPGAFAVYLEPWHADVFEFLDLKKNTGVEDLRARDLFYALWVPDLFMQRVEDDADWSLMCPAECPGLYDNWGEKFEEIYTNYEKQGKFRSKVKARKLWWHIIDCQIETGTPYILYKDSCNRKSNQQHLGTIRSSNLCTEIVEYTAPDEIAVCNLASIALNRFVDPKTREFDFEKLRHVTCVVTKNLNKVIDINHYPVIEAENSNKRHRPIGIGVQGLADAFIMMRLPFDSDEALKLNAKIFEHIYYAACKTSCELAIRDGPYSSFKGSPASQSPPKLQFDLWETDDEVPYELTLKDQWDELKKDIEAHGMRNSLLIAPMPTASTAQILGNNESFEPYTNNIYTRRVLSGEFQVVNHHLLKDLIDAKLWNEEMRQRIMRDYGSIQNIEEIPDNIKSLYKTVWEISQMVVIKQAAARGRFIDQSQSMNIHLAKPSRPVITSMHFYGWKRKLKTGMYYLRIRPAANPIQFTLDKTKIKAKKESFMGADTNSEAASSITNGDTNGNGHLNGAGDDMEVELIKVKSDAVEGCRLRNGPDCTSCGS